MSTNNRYNFRLGLENQDSVNLIYPWRLMEWDCLTYGKEFEEIQERNTASEEKYGTEEHSSMAKEPWMPLGCTCGASIGGSRTVWR